MRKTVKMTLKGKTFKKWASEQNIYEFEKKNKPRGCSDRVLGLHVYDLYSQTSLLVYILDLR